MAIFGREIIFTFSLGDKKFLEMLALPDPEFNFVSVFITKTWNCFRFPYFFNVLNFTWPFRKIRWVETAETSTWNWVCAGGRRDLTLVALPWRNRSRKLQYSAIFCFDLHVITRFENKWIIQNFSKSAKKSYFLEHSPVWAHLPGNVNFSPWSSRSKSGLTMVKCFR